MSRILKDTSSWTVLYTVIGLLYVIKGSLTLTLPFHIEPTDTDVNIRIFINSMINITSFTWPMIMIMTILFCGNRKVTFNQISIPLTTFWMILFIVQTFTGFIFFVWDFRYLLPSVQVFGVLVNVFNLVIHVFMIFIATDFTPQSPSGMKNAFKTFTAPYRDTGITIKNKLSRKDFWNNNNE